MHPLGWTSYSMNHIAKAVKALGYRISQKSVFRILKDKGFSMRTNRKEQEGKQHPDRHAQFEHINKVGLALQLAGAIMLSERV